MLSTHPYPQLPDWVMERASRLHLRVSDEEDNELSSSDGEATTNKVVEDLPSLHHGTQADSKTSNILGQTGISKNSLNLGNMPVQVQEYALIEDLLYVFMVSSSGKGESLICEMN